MRSKIVPVKNVLRLSAAADALINRAQGLPGMGIIFGPTGYGKTVATDYLVNHVNGVFVRALALSTPASLLGSILRELNLAPKGSCAAMVETIIESLARSRRPLFIDESDYLLDKKRLVETLRDLHDLSDAPVILIGEENLGRNLSKLPRLTRRIAQSVRFDACDIADARMLADQLAQVHISDALLERLHFEANGSIGLIVVGLTNIEAFTVARGNDSIDSSQWKGNFFVGRAPERVSKKATKVTPLHRPKS